jgi:hypothetical protein
MRPAASDTSRGIRFEIDKAVKLYKEGKKISEIALAQGFSKNSGQNRTLAALVKPGVAKPRESEK